jgi:hypothetical protein
MSARSNDVAISCSGWQKKESWLGTSAQSPVQHGYIHLLYCSWVPQSQAVGKPLPQYYLYFQGWKLISDRAKGSVVQRFGAANAAAVPPRVAPTLVVLASHAPGRGGRRPSPPERKLHA